MSIESALRELGKEIQKDERFVALQVAAKANDADESLQQQMQEMQLISLKYQQEAEKGEEASQDRIKEFQDDYQKLYTVLSLMMGTFSRRKYAKLFCRCI